MAASGDFRPRAMLDRSRTGYGGGGREGRREPGIPIVAYFVFGYSSYGNRDMQSRRWAVLTPIALLLAVAISDSDVRPPPESLADQCVGIYAVELPRDVRVRHVRQDGSNLIVYVDHLDWTGEIRCALYRDGSLDEVETLHRKIEVLWSEPPMPANP